MKVTSSQFFIPREEDVFNQNFRRVRLMPLYSFPCIREFDLNLKDNSKKIYFHMDIDAFFAQVEERDNPKYKGMPISVGGHVKGAGGICMTTNYKARAMGIDTGMSVVDAKKICPQLISLPCDGVKYEATVSEIQEIIKKYVPEDCLEQYSIDECFVNLSQIFRNINEAEKFINELQKEIFREQELTVSIGLSYNKSFAKMGTKFNKPNGISVIRNGEKERKIYTLPADKLWGIGRKIYRRMLAMGIITLGDLANFSTFRLRKEFGINGIVFQKCARGEDTSDIFVKSKKEQMIGHHHTGLEPICDENLIKKEIRKMAEFVGRKLRFKNLVTGFIYLSIRFENLTYTGGEYKLSSYTNDDEEIHLAALEIYRKMKYKPFEYLKLRMCGLNACDLHEDTGERNLNIFKAEKNLPFKELDFLKMKYGEKIIRLGLN